MDIAESDLLFIDVDASTPTVKQEQEDVTEYEEKMRMPTKTQFMFLLDKMEKNPELAKGCIRTNAGRQRARKIWDHIRLRLNSMKGTKKNTSQWMKYWTDKKTSVKKKAAEGEMELTDIEEKILYLSVGVGGAFKVERNTQESTPEPEADVSNQFDASDEASRNLPNLRLQSAPSSGYKCTSNCQTHGQTQSSFERILKIEERRLSMEKSNAQLMRTILEQSAQRERTILDAVNCLNDRLNERNERENAMAGALKTLGEGLLALSKVLKSNK